MNGNSDGRTDAQLLVDSTADPDVFALLYEHNVDSVLAYFFRRTGCAQTAADLTAETFAQAFTSRSRFSDIGAPARAWLFTIARRQLARFARRQKVSRRYRNRVGLAPMELSAAEFEQVEAAADAATWASAIRESLDRIPPGQAEAVRLRVALDLDYSEVASHLGCSEGAARVRVSRGLTNLVKLLEGP